MAFLSTPWTQLWEPVPMLNSYHFSLQIILPFFNQVPLSIAKNGELKELFMHWGLMEQTSVLDYLLPPLSPPGVQFLCAAPAPGSRAIAEL